MPRPLRAIDDRLIYYVINRGNNRQDVFHKEADFEAFLKALGELKQRMPFELYGYCLLNNHFHLLVRPLAASIGRIMQSLLSLAHAALSQTLPLRRACVARAVQKPRDSGR